MDLTRWITFLLLCCLLTACATNGDKVPHSFGFDTRSAAPPVEVLDYRYGSSGMTGTRPAQWEIEKNRPYYFDSVTGLMPIGDYLYVKWRLKETGEVYEDTVDLRQRLPKDISEHRIYFDIQGAQLHVYLVSPDFLPKGAPRNSLRMYPHNRVMALYPDPSPR